MNSGRIAIGFIIIIALAAMTVLKTATMPTVYAANNITNATTASVTVNGVVEVTIQNAPIAFGSLDSGISGSAATNNPLNITFGGNTNVPVEVYLNGSRFEWTSNNFLVPNMSYNATVSGTGSVNTSCSTARCRYGTVPSYVLNETAPLGTPKNASVFHYIDVPVGQAPGGPYTANVRVCTRQTGSAGCV